jgi:hypothetical protein
MWLAMFGSRSVALITGYLGIHRDISERERAEEALREAQRRSDTILEPLAEAAGDRRDRGGGGVVGARGEGDRRGAHGALVALLPAGEQGAELLVAAGSGVGEQRRAVLDVEQRIAQRLVSLEQVVGRHRARARQPARERGRRVRWDVAGRGGGADLGQHGVRVRRADGEPLGLGPVEPAAELLPVRGEPGA